LNRIEERDFKREELPEKYMAKVLYRWNDRKFEEEYFKSWRGTGENRSQFLQRKNLKGEVMLELKIVDSILFLFSFSFLFYFNLFSILDLG